MGLCQKATPGPCAETDDPIDSGVDLMEITSRFNGLLYRRALTRLTRSDLDMARAWTLQLIRDSHPRWTEEEVARDYERLSLIRVEVVDEWSKRYGMDVLE